ncbi:uncharacterized protein LOC120849826 [Ixodes scapularis]|uniref:uncharacterized protein LOC120849826 n=1 Tax=Ixodes scapularis TaxID=6945 RepID=UPI001A9E80F4|nr:uncharacterized protein LOC120849826 [Ixodes scapularis]
MHQEAQSHRLTTSNQGRALLEVIGQNSLNLPSIPLSEPPCGTLPHTNVRPIPKHRKRAHIDLLSYHVGASCAAGKVVPASTDPYGHTIVNHYPDVPSVQQQN